jgi:hypothetical protein
MLRPRVLILNDPVDGTRDEYCWTLCLGKNSLLSESWFSDFRDETKHRLYVDRPSPRRTAVEWLFAMPCQVVSYLVAHTFGLRLVYPGSISVLQYVMCECVATPNILYNRSMVVCGNYVIMWDLSFSQLWLKNTVFWNVMPHSLVEVYWHSSGTLLNFYWTTQHCTPGHGTFHVVIYLWAFYHLKLYVFIRGKFQCFPF